VQRLGTTVLIQDPSECEAHDMPISAIQTKDYDFILKTDEVRSLFSTLFYISPMRDDAIRLLLKELHTLYGYDFADYNRDTVLRRLEAVQQRMGITTLSLFVKEVLTDRRVFDELLLSVSINVTEFFRKPPLYIGFQKLLEDKFNDRGAKIWIAGSSTGEEPYSVAMMLHQFGIYDDSLIYATDFNSVILEEASNGLFSKERVFRDREKGDEVLGAGKFMSYFENMGGYFSVSEDIRKKLLFFSHNLATDSSFNQFDIISCKNVLIYFNRELQEHVFQLFYDSLEVGGFLLLGESEVVPLSFRDRFKNYDILNKIYVKGS
jgi:chemotaxis protein methyltransferase CheR